MRSLITAAVLLLISTTCHGQTRALDRAKAGYVRSVAKAEQAAVAVLQPLAADLLAAGDASAAAAVRDLVYRVRLGRLKTDASASDLFGLPEPALSARAELLAAIESAAADLDVGYDREVGRAGVDLALALRKEQRQLRDGSYRPTGSIDDRNVAVVKFAAGGSLNGQSAPVAAFPLNSTVCPDVLAIAAVGQRATISGSGTAPFTPIAGITRKSFGRAILFDRRAASGLIVVNRATSRAVCQFVAIGRGESHLHFGDLQPGQVYSWQVKPASRQQLTVEIRRGADVIAEGTFPRVPFGWQCLVRQGESIDVAVCWD